MCGFAGIFHPQGLFDGDREILGNMSRAIRFRGPDENSLVSLGEIAFASNRFEIFVDYEHRIQARSPFLQTFIVQLAAQPELDNGTYLPTERGLWGRGFGASVYDNIVTPEAGQIIVEESLKAFPSLEAETDLDEGKIVLRYKGYPDLQLLDAVKEAVEATGCKVSDIE